MMNETKHRINYQVHISLKWIDREDCRINDLLEMTDVSSSNS